MYAQTLKRLKVPFWQATTDWHCFNADGVIVATPPATHYSIARTCLGRRIPVIVEKPVCCTSRQVRDLVAMGGIAFAGHTRLYSPAWREFRRPAQEVTATVADWWDWGPHAVAMAFDLGCKNPKIEVGGERMTFVADGRTFTDVETQPTPLEVLVTEFIAAIKDQKPDNRLSPEVIEYLESHEPSRLHVA